MVTELFVKKEFYVRTLKKIKVFKKIKLYFFNKKIPMKK